MYDKDSYYRHADFAHIEHAERKGFSGRRASVKTYTSNWRSVSLRYLFFPVSTRPLYWERDNEYDLVLRECPRHFAIVDDELNYVFSTVTEDYKLVPNAEAHRLGTKLAESIFVSYHREKIDAINCFLGNNRATCEFDLVREIQAGQPFIAEEWMPMLRVGNSYNKKKALEFNIGFLNISLRLHVLSRLPLKFPHNAIASEENFDGWIERVKADKTVQKEIQAFSYKMTELRHLSLSSNLILQLYCKYSEVTINSSMRDEKKDEAKSQISRAERILSRYSPDYGTTAYTLLLVLATCIEDSQNCDGYTADQRKLGKWSDELLMETRKPHFSWSGYIGPEAADTVAYYETHR